MVVLLMRTMELCTWTVLLTAFCINLCSSHVSQWSYIKPYENATCPGHPCMTFQEYTKAKETYMVSGMKFVFLSGEHHYDGNLRLDNITDMYFQGDETSPLEHPAQITISPNSNITFIASYNIVFSGLLFTLSGSPVGKNNIFASLAFQNTSVKLVNLTVVGSKSSYASTAFLFCFCLTEISNTQIAKAKSMYGPALFIFNSTAILSGRNIFNDNLAKMAGGAIIALENSTITFSGVNLFEGNRAYFGGTMIASSTILRFDGIAIFVHNRANSDGGAIALQNGTVLLQRNHGNLYFRGNFALKSGGAVFVSSGSQMFLSNAGFEMNNANSLGGALNVVSNSNITIQNSLIANNSALIGGAINLNSHSHLQFLGYNYIEHNTGILQSGGINAHPMSRIEFGGNNYFVNNTANGYGGAVAIIFTKISVNGNLSFFDNNGHRGGAITAMSSKVEFGPYTYVMFERNMALVQGGGIFSIDSTWNIKGNLAFCNNFATQGGAMSHGRNSKLILNKFSKIMYSQNHADTNGGAIYVADRIPTTQCRVFFGDGFNFCSKPNTTSVIELCRLQDDCFVELNGDFPFDISTSNISLTFFNNSAGKSGTAIFGGSLDNCRLYLGGGFQDSCGHKIGREYTENALPTILQISTIDNMSSAISSEPFRVCFCDHNEVPDCEMNVTVKIIRGKRFTLSAVTVGQGNFTVSSSIKADFGNSTSTTLSQLQRVQDTANTCTDISYRLFSAEDSVTMILFPDGPCRDTGFARHEVRVTFLPCPDGFIHVDTECMCDERFNAFNTSCNVDNGKIRRPDNSFWVMAIYDNLSYQGLLLHSDRCPFDFCVETAVEINLEDPDIQCNHNHSGILCGSCQTNFSLTLGTLRCLSCSHAYLTLILVFALAGIALVVLLLLLQLTVAHGTINGLVFYANVVQVNRDIFFPPGLTNVLTVFIAWLNLDLGIETCFYDGMNAYAFTWLQFVFPFYVWFLIGIIIFLSHYSVKVSRWLGDNPVSVLATLFLLSYSKILRTIIAVLSYTTLQYPDGSHQRVWLYDGSVPYFQRVDHILLGVFAISALCLLFLPYTILLFTGHWLHAHSNWKIFSWMNKLKPFMDTYHGPFKRETRYWTGFLLLVRCVLFLTFAFNALGNVSINLLAVISVTVGLMTLAWLQNRLYKEIYNDILEACFILNLCIFASATYHIRETKKQQDKLAYTSAGIAFVLFICISLYHIFRCISQTKAWKVLPKQHLRDYDKIREVIHGIKIKSKYNGQRNAKSAQVPSVTVIELNEPMMDYSYD